MARGLERPVDAVVRVADDLQLVDGVGGGGLVELHAACALSSARVAASVRSTRGSLKPVLVGGMGVGEQVFCDSLRAVRQGGVRRLHRPGLVRHAAEGDPPRAVRLDDCRDGDQGEGVGGAVAHLGVGLPAATGLGSVTAVINSPGSGRSRPPACRRAGGGSRRSGWRGRRRPAHRLDRRVEHAHGHRHVARVGGDAGLARADHRDGRG